MPAPDRRRRARLEDAHARGDPAEMSAPRDRLAAYVDAVETRHLADLSFSEARRALQALSSLYVERRARMRSGAALAGAGKRAAFALYYPVISGNPIHESLRGLLRILRSWAF